MAADASLHSVDPDSVGGAPDPAGLPARPALRPGVHVVRRDDRHLQVGVDLPSALVVPDDPGTRRLLEDLRTGAPPATDSPAARRLLSDLWAHGLVVDGAARDSALRAAADRAAVAATWAEYGDDAPRRLVARADARVLVDGPPDQQQAAARLLRSSGVGLAGSPEKATTVLVLADSVLPRAGLDPVLRAGLPHLVVAPGSEGLGVGPFVVPGLTACLRCVDAHLAERDPRRSMLLEQCGPATLAAGPRPRDPALLTLAVALAVREVVSFVDGDEPATWSASITVAPDLGLDRRTWRRHPHCGCAWGDLLAV